MFIAVVFTVAKLWTQPRYLPTDEWIKEMQTAGKDMDGLGLTACPCTLYWFSYSKAYPEFIYCIPNTTAIPLDFNLVIARAP